MVNFGPLRSRRSLIVSLVLSVVGIVLAYFLKRRSSALPPSSKSLTRKAIAANPAESIAERNNDDDIAPVARVVEFDVSTPASEGAESFDAATECEIKENSSVRKESSKSSSRKSGEKSRSSKGRSSLATDGKAKEGLPDFIMLMGIPGSGKSRWAKDYVFRCDASFTVISSDEIRKQVTGNINDQSRNDEVWDIVQNQVVGALKSKKNVILDATNCRTDYRRIFVRQLPPCNRYLKVFSVLKAIAKGRIAKDLEQGAERAEVPDVILDKMAASFSESMSLIREEGWMMKT